MSNSEDSVITTPSRRRFLQQVGRREGAHNVTIEIQATDGRNVPLADVHWSAEGVRLEATYQ